MNRAPFAAARLPVFYASASRPDLAPAGLPDWDDPPMTTFDGSPFALEHIPPEPAPESIAPATEPAPATGPATSVATSAPSDAPAHHPASFVRARSADVTGPMPNAAWAEASAFLDVMGELQLNLGVSLLCLDDAVGTMPYDRSAVAASETLRTRIQELTDLRDALNELYLDATDPSFAPLFAADAPLTAYLKGVYLWAGDVAIALDDLAKALRLLQPDWFALRTRLERAAMWYFDGLPNEIRPELARLGVSESFTAKVEEVFFAARFLAHGLEKRFG